MAIVVDEGGKRGMGRGGGRERLRQRKEERIVGSRFPTGPARVVVFSHWDFLSHTYTHTIRGKKAV